MRTRRIMWQLVVIVGFAIAAGLYSPGVWERAAGTSTTVIAAPRADQLTDLLNRVQVIDVMPSVPGYERGCKRG